MEMKIPMCKVCFESPTAAILLPCRHFCWCWVRFFYELSCLWIIFHIVISTSLFPPFSIRLYNKYSFEVSDPCCRRQVRCIVTISTNLFSARDFRCETARKSKRPRVYANLSKPDFTATCARSLVLLGLLMYVNGPFQQVGHQVRCPFQRSTCFWGYP